ncbi:efflux transporter outer membrane subunit [Massilia sp. ST3]|uniref:efflux transporter outer membrane subunit n=1 Tax=Massilia sp. ST3 TaxID=2824903 RepID=UPI001B81C42D|nr:efflux transporter outer membrane subunit [Massilia sp. ST3]MBQ5947982.1 efflux transporter outer membrane subunit [Massilia sp. ST3]
MRTFTLLFSSSLPGSRRAASLACGLLLAGCVAGPDFVKPSPAAPEDWSSWRSADPMLRIPAGTEQSLPAKWWQAFGDPMLDSLQQRAQEASPDLRSAALRFAQARVQRAAAPAQGAPQLGASGGVQRQRQSEYGAGTRLSDVIAADRDTVAGALSQPFTLYQAGFDASWEPDLWGRVKRSVEAADAGVAQQAALFDLARLSLASDLARHYLELRGTRRQIRLAHEDVDALGERLRLLEARVRSGASDHLDLERQRAELAAARVRLPGLLAEEGASINQIALLLGERPGALDGMLASDQAGGALPALPDLQLGLPSEVALRRPDIRAAEARLHRAVARVGVAQADLYPSVRLGAHFGAESYLDERFGGWGSRTWSIGPSLDLPLFDGGRRRSTVRLRELEQQEAAVDYQRVVLKAWQEIDDALSAYAAEQRQADDLQARVRSSGEAYRLTQARYQGGAVDFVAVLDSQRSHLQARRELAASETRLAVRYVALNKAIGNTGGRQPR